MTPLFFSPAAHGPLGGHRMRRIGVALLIALPLLAAGAYALQRNGGALPTEAEAGVPTATDAMPATELREGLVAHLARNPRDARSLILLARLEFSHDRFAEAADAYRSAIDASTKAQSDPGIWCEYADALGMAQGGSLAGQPRDIVLRTLVRKPGFPRALEMAGSAAFEAREYADAARYWRELMEQLPEQAPARGELAAAAERAELLAAGGRR